MTRNANRQGLFAVLLVAALVLAQVGCAKQTTSAEPVTLRIAYYPKVVDLKPLLETYIRENPGITVEAFELDQSNFPSLMDEIEKGEMDIVREFSDTFVAQVRDGVFEPLGGYLESSDWLKLREDYFNGTWEGLQAGSQQYAIPASMDMYITYANLDIFENAGVEPPNDTWTVDDLVTIGSAVNQPEGRPGGEPAVVFGFGTQYLSPDPVIFTYLHGGAIVDNFDDPSTAYLDSPGTVEAARYYTSLISEYKLSPKTSLLGTYFGYYGITTAAMQGYCALWFGLFSGRGATADASGEVVKWPFAWKMLPLPQDKQAVALGDVDGYYVPISSQHKQEALKLIRWLSDQALAAGTRFPVRKSLAQDAAYMKQVGEETARIGALAAENLLRMPNIYGRYGPQGALLIFYTSLRGILDSGDDLQASLEEAQIAATQEILAAQQGATPEGE